jgi:hypothetical protein
LRNRIIEILQRGKGTEIEGKDALFVKYWKFVVFCKKRLQKVKKESILSNGKNSVTE